MYSETSLLYVLVALAMIVTFFIIAFKVSKINSTLDFFKEIALRDPANWNSLKCEKCGKEFRVSKAMKGTTNCPNCMAIIKIKEESSIR